MILPRYIKGLSDLESLEKKNPLKKKRKIAICFNLVV